MLIAGQYLHKSDPRVSIIKIEGVGNLNLI